MNDKEFQDRLAAVKMAARLDTESWARLRSKLLADLDQEWPYGDTQLKKAVTRFQRCKWPYDRKRTPDKG